MSAVLKCPHCEHSFAATVTQVREKQPASVRRELKDETFRFSWWKNEWGADLRPLAAILVVAIFYFAAHSISGVSSNYDWRLFLHPLRARTQDWASVGQVLLAFVLGAVLIYGVFLKFCRRAVVEWNGTSLRSWTEPLRHGVTELQHRELERLFVHPNGELRCQTGPHVQRVVTLGPLPTLRYVEQQLEDLIRGNGIVTCSVDVKVECCPNCQFQLSAAEEVLQPAREAPTDILRGKGLELSWRWRNPRLIFLGGAGLACWDGLCLAIVARGLKMSGGGDYGGLSVFLWPQVWVGVGLTYLYFCCLVNRTHVFCDGRMLRTYCAPLPLPQQCREGYCDKNTQFWIVERAGRNHYSLEVDCYPILREMRGDRVHYVEQELARYLNPAGPPTLEPAAKPPQYARRMIPARSSPGFTLASGFLLCLMFLLCAEMGAGELCRRFPVQIDELHNPSDLLYKIKTSSHGRPFALLLGGSVLHWTALANHGEVAPTAKSVGAVLAQTMEAHYPNFSLVDVSMDGALLGDYQGIVDLLEREQLKPSGVLLQIDYRIFSQLHSQESFLSRKWLGPPEVDGLRPIDQWVDHNILQRSDLALLSAGMKALNFRVNGGLQPRSKSPTPDELKLRVAPYFSSDDSFEHGQAIKLLERLLDHLQTKQIPTMVVFTPINRTFLGNTLNRQAYRYNVAYLNTWFAFRYGQDRHFRWVNLDGLLPDSLLLDHTHGNAEGNQEMARLIFESWQIFAYELSRHS